MVEAVNEAVHDLEEQNEKKCSGLPKYNASMPMWLVLCSWRGTVLPLTLGQTSFWLMVAFHAAFIVLAKTAGEDWRPANYSLLSVPGTMLVFFLVFYSGQCYTRFFTMYAHCVGIGGATMQWVAIIKLHVRDDANVQWNCVRFMLAAAHVAYYGLHGDFESGGWDTIKGRDLLSEDECSQIRAFTGFKPFLPITWGMHEVKRQLRVDSKAPLETVLEWDEIQRIGFALRGEVSQLENLLKMPVPWACASPLTAPCRLALPRANRVLVVLAAQTFTC